MADQKLTEIAQGMVNNEALRVGSMQARVRPECPLAG